MAKVEFVARFSHLGRVQVGEIITTLLLVALL